MNIKDVARRAGVSISTVSNALNGRRNVSQETREAVLAAAAELGYVPNINARLMKARHTGNIGLFLPYIDGPFYQALLTGVYHACAAAGYAMFAHVAEGYDSKKVAATMLSCNIDGAVVLNDHLRTEDVALITQRGLPMVFLDRQVCQQGTGSIVLHNEKGVIQQVEYLKHTGHCRVAYMRGFDNYDGTVRYETFRRAMEKCEMPVREEWVFQGLFDTNVAYSAMRGYFATFPKEIPDAVLCANDEMAIGCIRALADVGLRVPDDVSVLGFDDVGVAEHCDPPLTTAHYSMKELAETAIGELVRLMGDPEAQGNLLTVDVNLVLRDSVKLRYTGSL